MATYKQRMRQIRGMLDYMWGEMDAAPRDTPGINHAKRGVADAIEALDMAILACPDEPDPQDRCYVCGAENVVQRQPWGHSFCSSHQQPAGSVVRRAYGENVQPLRSSGGRRALG